MNEAVETVEAKRGPGRPPNKNVEVKKGHPTWRPANVDETYDKEAGYRYRWINEDQTNLMKKEMEQWEPVSDVSGTKTKSEVGYGRINDGAPLTTVRKRVGQVLARIPEEVAQERDKYVNARSGRSMEALKRQTRDELSREGAPIHGGITMEKKGVRTVIRD